MGCDRTVEGEAIGETTDEIAENKDQFYLAFTPSRPLSVRTKNMTSAGQQNSMTVYVDGGCSNNANPDLSKRWMVSVVVDDKKSLISEKSCNGGSNNIAELIAVRDALRWAAETGVKSLRIVTDSRNNFAWTFGKKLGKHLNDYHTVRNLKSEIDIYLDLVRVDMIWVPRHLNFAGHYIENKHKL